MCCFDSFSLDLCLMLVLINVCDLGLILRDRLWWLFCCLFCVFLVWMWYNCVLVIWLILLLLGLVLSCLVRV